MAKNQTKLSFSGWEDPRPTRSKKKILKKQERLEKSFNHEFELLEKLMNKEVDFLVKHGIIYPPDDHRMHSPGRNFSTDFNMSPHFYFCKEDAHQSITVQKCRRLANRLFEVKQLRDKLHKGWVIPIHKARFTNQKEKI